ESQYVLLRRAGVLYPLAVATLFVPQLFGRRLTGPIAVLVIVGTYMSGLILTVTFIEWRMFVVAILAIMCAGAAALSALRSRHPRLHDTLLAAQGFFLLTSATFDAAHLFWS